VKPAAADFEEARAVFRRLMPEGGYDFGDSSLLELANLVRRARMAPPDPVMIDVRELQNRDLDFWTGRAMGFNRVKANDDRVYFEDASGHRHLEYCPTFNDIQASTVMESPGFVELKMPAQPGDPWEAWFDLARATGAHGAGVIAMPGSTWKEAVCRAKVAGTFGAVFDANQPPQQPPKGAPLAQFGVGRAITGPAQPTTMVPPVGNDV
jgi:hypothetical protein